MTASFRNMLDRAYEGKTIEEILESSPSALLGVSEADALKLKEAFGIETIKDMAECNYFQHAQALLAAAGWPDYDPGPPLNWQEFFARAPVYEDYWPDKFRWEYGPIFYRGRLDRTARVLIIGQDPSTDEAIARRAFVGRSGQRLQGLLKKIGILRSYVMVNTFLYSVYGQFDDDLREISLNPIVLDYRNEMLDILAQKNEIEVVLTIGVGARHACEHWPGAQNYTVYNLVHPAAPEDMVLPNWNEHLPLLRGLVTPDEGAEPDTSLYGAEFTAEDHVLIPRLDLPFGMPAWHGTGGTHSHRNGPKEIIWEGPE